MRVFEFDGVQYVDILDVFGDSAWILGDLHLYVFDELFEHKAISITDLKKLHYFVWKINFGHDMVTNRIVPLDVFERNIDKLCGMLRDRVENLHAARMDDIAHRIAEATALTARRHKYVSEFSGKLPMLIRPTETVVGAARPIDPADLRHMRNKLTESAKFSPEIIADIIGTIVSGAN